jgi:hypothetical protein
MSSFRRVNNFQLPHVASSTPEVRFVSTLIRGWAACLPHNCFSLFIPSKNPIVIKITKRGKSALSLMFAHRENDFFPVNGCWAGKTIGN